MIRRPVLLGLALGLPLVALLGPAPAGAVVLTIVLLGHRQRSARRRRQQHVVRAAVLEGVLALAAALRGGVSASRAWQQAAEATSLAGGGDLLGPVARAPERGGDLLAALADAARTPGARDLARVAVCWSVASHTGSGLASSLEIVADGLRAEDALRRQVAAELAAPRATARVLAGLPVVGVALGAAGGARPGDVLLHSALGHLCLLLGCTLAAAGLLWIERLSAAAAPRSAISAS